MTWWIILLAIPVAFMSWIFAHEGAHAIIALIQKNKVTGFYPYPHKHNGKLYFGRMSTAKASSTALLVAPFVVDVVAFVSLAALLFVPALPDWAWSLLVVAAACSVVDSFVAVLGFVRGNVGDLKRAGDKWAVAAYIFVVASVAVVVLATGLRF